MKIRTLFREFAQLEDISKGRYVDIPVVTVNSASMQSLLTGNLIRLQQTTNTRVLDLL